MGKKLPIFVDIQKVHEKWRIFCFYGMFWSVVVFEIITFEILNLLQALRCNTQTFLNFCGKIDFCINFLNFHKMNIVVICIAKWDEQNDTKIIQFEHCFGLLKRKHETGFRFNNSKQFSNWIILDSFYSSNRVVKNCYIVHFMKI